MLSGTLRVCHLGKYYPPAPGGIETHVRTLARAQATAGADVQVICINHADDRGRDVTWSRYGATRTAQETDGAVRVTRLGRSAHIARLDILPDLRPAFRRFKETPVDVVHLHTPNPTMLLAVAALRPWAPLVITHHSDIVRQRVLRCALRPFERLVYARAARVLSNSPVYINGSPLLQRHHDRVEMLPMGLDLAPYVRPSAGALAHAANLRARYGPVLWLAVGRCVYYKGLEVAVRALTKVPGTLMIVGKGPTEGRLRHLAHELGVTDRVAWCGEATPDELAGAYQAATALWFPSNARSEPFGLTIIEAMSCGRPTVISRAGGAAELFTDDHDAIGFPPGDPAALAAAVIRLISEPDTRTRLGRNARESVVRRFGHERLASQVAAVYEAVFQSASPSGS